MHFKFGYDVPRQAPVPTPNNPRSIQYRPMLEFRRRGGNWWAKPVQHFEVYLGGTLMGSVGVLHNAGWGAWAHGLNGDRGLGVRPTRAQAAWLVLNRVWESTVHLPGRNDAYVNVFVHGDRGPKYIGHVVSLKWGGWLAYREHDDVPDIYAETKHKAVVALKEEY